MEKESKIDEILRDIEDRKATDAIVNEELNDNSATDGLLEDALKKREEQIKGFSLDLDVDDLIADAADGEGESTAPSMVIEPAQQQPIEMTQKEKPSRLLMVNILEA